MSIRTIAISILVFVALSGAGYYTIYRLQSVPVPVPEPTPAGDTPPVVGVGEHCGGFIRNAPVCGTGSHCQLKINNPDTGGTCVAGDATSASGTPPGDKGILPYKSGIKGTITLGPTCPVMRNPPDPQCADKPYLGLVSIYRASDMTHVIVSKKTNADGTFVVDIAPGDYIVGAGENTLPRCPQTVARVGPNVYTEITISCDTGIR